MGSETIEELRRGAWRQAIEELKEEYSDSPYILRKIKSYEKDIIGDF